MPRAKYKPITTKNLARTMIAILAMDPPDLEIIAERMAADVELTKPLAEEFKRRNVSPPPNCDNLAKLFDAILQLPKDARTRFVGSLNRLLNDLYVEDFFGTEGQVDPRGSHRDLDAD